MRTPFDAELPHLTW